MLYLASVLNPNNPDAEIIFTHLFYKAPDFSNHISYAQRYTDAKYSPKYAYYKAALIFGLAEESGYSFAPRSDINENWLHISLFCDYVKNEKL